MSTSTEASSSPAADVCLRCNVQAADAAAVRAIVTATGKFRPGEIDVAEELVTETLAKGAAAGYLFTFAEIAGVVVGYACYGQIPCTLGSYDLYWIAVDPATQGRGLGRLLVDAAEQHVRGLGGRRMFIDTSSRPDYAATRSFYERCGYACEATLRDYYAPGDGKAIFAKDL
ncbi:MAG TPA: GNAT family N-acetyltransferase [Phycisphaerae bacterium]|nr:GNAT family N-acetyltransferase [Phycisphaerae bacterium]